MSQEFEKHIEEYARSAFKDHASKLVAPNHLSWRKPGTSMYATNYVIHGNTLCVFGDVDDAVYAWSSAITFEFLAGCSLQYFQSKCMASPHGRGFWSWDPAVAKRYVDDVFAEYESDNYESERYKKARGEFTEYGGYDAMGSEQEFMHWMWENGRDVFGEEWYEYRFGKVPAPGCIYHLTGLKMAVEQLAAVPA